VALIPRLRRKRKEASMTLIEHLEELRSRLIVSFLAIGVGAIAGWFLFDPTVRLLREPYCDVVGQLPKPPIAGCDLVFFGAIDAVVLKLKVVAFIGLFIALPVVLYQLWAFIVPGLTDRERKLAIPFVASSVLLFAFGAVMAYYTLPRGLGFLLNFAGEPVRALLGAKEFIGFVMLMALAFGVSFEFPLLLIFLAAVGIVSSQTLRRWRRMMIVGLALVAAVITPSQDPYTMFAMLIPMVALYEGAILVTRLMKK